LGKPKSFYSAPLKREEIKEIKEGSTHSVLTINPIQWGEQKENATLKSHLSIMCNKIINKRHSKGNAGECLWVARSH